jgi:nitrogen fixation protein NifU and related proteins
VKMEKELSQLYDTVILQHNRTPFNYEKRLTAQHIVEAYNPLCGDKFKLFLDIENGIVQKATFHGYGCAVSKAATSVLVKKLQDLPVHDVPNLIKAYFEALNTEGVKEIGTDEELNAFAAVSQFPERMTCATLSWEAAKVFFQQ